MMVIDWDDIPEASSEVRGHQWACTVRAHIDASLWQKRLQENLALGTLRAYEFAFEVGHGNAQEPFPHFHVFVWTAARQRGRSYLRNLLRQDAHVARCVSTHSYRRYLRKQQTDDFLVEHLRLLPPDAKRFYSAGRIDTQSEPSEFANWSVWHIEESKKSSENGSVGPRVLYMSLVSGGPGQLTNVARDDPLDLSVTSHRPLTPKHGTASQDSTLDMGHRG